MKRRVAKYQKKMHVFKRIKKVYYAIFGVFVLVIVLSLTLSALNNRTSTQHQAAPGDPQPVGQDGEWNLIFSDEFNSQSLDSSKWTPCFYYLLAEPPAPPGSCRHEVFQQQLYTPLNVSVSNGMLILTAKKERLVEDKAYTSGLVTTGPKSDKDPYKFKFTYGYMEIRAKVNNVKGTWPAFWAITEGKYDNEIDIFEILGNQPNTVFLTHHYDTDGVKQSKQQQAAWKSPTSFADDFHVFAANWEPDAITWYVDGVERFKFTDAANISNRPNYLLVDLAIGGEGSWPGLPDSSSVFPNYLQVDYVRVWKKGASADSRTSRPSPTAVVPTAIVPTFVCEGSCPTPSPAVRVTEVAPPVGQTPNTSTQPSPPQGNIVTLILQFLSQLFQFLSSIFGGNNSNR